jgi:hypothetical protein
MNREKSSPVPTRRVGGREKPVKITWARMSGRRPDYVAYVFVLFGGIIICQLYKVTLSHQAQVTLELRFSLSDLVQMLLAGPNLLEVGSKKNISSGSQPALGGPDNF